MVDGEQIRAQTLVKRSNLHRSRRSGSGLPSDTRSFECECTVYLLEIGTVDHLTHVDKTGMIPVRNSASIIDEMIPQPPASPMSPT